MTYYDDDRTNYAGWVLALLVLVGLLAWPVSSYFEARAYNSVTGADVSTWDAMFIELRVQGAPK